MARRVWGVRDTYNGAVYRAISFDAAQHAANSDSRLELVTAIHGSVGWHPPSDGDISRALGTPLPPRAARSTAFWESGGMPGSARWCRWLYGLMGRVISGVGSPFRKHNG
jgi:hypothetical protein